MVLEAVYVMLNQLSCNYRQSVRIAGDLPHEQQFEGSYSVMGFLSKITDLKQYLRDSLARFFTSDFFLKLLLLVTGEAFW